MIVKNEAANIERCLASVAPHVDGYAIVDTGSSDDTPGIIAKFMYEGGLSGGVRSAPFIDFSQARNAALDFAESYGDAYDWLLLIDADMELVTEDDLREIVRRASATAPEADSFHLMQWTPDGVMYPNIRLVRRGAGGRYEGATHEGLVLEAKVSPLLGGVVMRDWQTGSNRKDKAERDIRLLTQDLARKPDDPRTVFYLAQSYGTAEQPEKAAALYGQRAEMKGTWEEERWIARLYEAREKYKAGDQAGFVATAVKAYQERPTRAEPLVDLARHYRSQKLYHFAAMLAERAMEIAPPEQEMIFVEASVYTWQAREEFVLSASATSDPALRERAFRVCNDLALDRTIEPAARYSARNNLFAFARPLKERCPSYQSWPLQMTPPAGYSLGLPSIARLDDDHFLMTQRCVNYEITILPNGGAAFPTRDGGPIRSRSFLLLLDHDLRILREAEIAPPPDLKTSSRIQGCEDLRLTVTDGAPWVTGMAMSPEPEEVCQQIHGRIDLATNTIVDWRILPSPRNSHEKNWMPIAREEGGWIYLCDPTVVLDAGGTVVAASQPPFCAEVMCGGSQLIPFDDGWLAFVHEHVTNPLTKWRAYLHRLVWFDRDFHLRKCSMPFCLEERGVEYVAGLAWRDSETLVFTRHVNDRESWLATLAAADARNLLEEY